jgi:hypothetical protein
LSLDLWSAFNSSFFPAPSHPQAQPEEANAEPEGEEVQDPDEEEHKLVTSQCTPRNQFRVLKAGPSPRAPAIITFKQRAGPKGYVKVEMPLLAFECMQPTAIYRPSPVHPPPGD